MQVQDTLRLEIQTVVVSTILAREYLKLILLLTAEITQDLSKMFLVDVAQQLAIYHGDATTNHLVLPVGTVL